MPDIEERRQYKREWQKANADRIRERRNEQSRERRRRDPEKAREQYRKYREAHREELRQRARAYREADPERQRKIQAKSHAKNREYQKQLYRRLRADAIAAYGGECACCGEKTLAFLTIDHIHNDGGEHRRNGSGSGIGLYRWLKRENYPQGRFQVLCYNCNCSKQHDPAGHRAAHPRAREIDGGEDDVAQQDCK